MKKEEITSIDKLKQYLSEEYSDQSWYDKTTTDDIAELYHLLETNQLKVSNIPDTMLEIQTRRLLETMSDEELANLVDSTKDKSTKEDDTEEINPNDLLEMSEEEAKTKMQTMSSASLEELIQKFEKDEDISDGVAYLKMGYVEYARTVICERAIANVYDGLKPVNRRILQTIKNKDVKGLIKSARIAGDTLALHPHGEGSVYQASVLMTDINGSLSFPSLAGHGNFGYVNTTDTAAAMRYTEVKLHKNTDEYFRELHGINMLPNFDNTTEEAELLPVSFPAVLVNCSSGIAVGWSSNIPSFNFNDICDLVIENIKKGKCTTVICPDFVTGGYYVKNDKELQKLMRTGTATLKMRSKVHIDKKTIHVEELPYGQTLQKVIKKINDLDYQYIRNAYETLDIKHDEFLAVECTSATQVDNVLHYLYKRTPIQSNFSASIVVIQNGVPKTLGVWQVIDEWVKWRREVLEKDYSWHIKKLQKDIRECQTFMSVVNDKTRCYELINVIVTQGKQAGIQYVTERFTREEVPEDLIEFVATRSLPSYYDGGKYATDYNRLVPELTDYTNKYNDIDGTIIAQMKELKKTYGKKLKRRTEITTQDFNFTSKEERNKTVDKSTCYYEFRNNFVRKVKSPSVRDKNTICAKANSAIVVADSMGRLIRIYGEDLSYSTTAGDMGTYIPNYAKVPYDENYQTKLVGIIDGTEYCILYDDGYVAFVDTKPWLENSRHTKVISKGIHKGTLSNICAVFSTTPQYMLLVDAHNYMIYLDLNDIKHKGSASRTKLCNLARKTLFTKYYVPEEPNCINNIEKYSTGRPKPLDITDLATISFNDFVEF